MILRVLCAFAVAEPYYGGRAPVVLQSQTRAVFPFSSSTARMEERTDGAQEASTSQPVAMEKQALLRVKRKRKEVAAEEISG